MNKEEARLMWENGVPSDKFAEMFGDIGDYEVGTGGKLFCSVVLDVFRYPDMYSPLSLGGLYFWESGIEGAIDSEDYEIN